MQHIRGLGIFLRILGLVTILTGCLSHRAIVAEGQPETSSPQQDPASQIDVSQILIRFAGVGGGDVTASRQEALELAMEVARRARAGESFEDLARKHSEAPSAARGGDVGIVTLDNLARPVADAALALKVGEISDPVETEAGFHVVRRNALVLIATRQIVIMHIESSGIPPDVKRTKAEALKMIQEILARARAGEDFVELARKYSDAARAGIGGDMGYYGRGARLPRVEAAAFALEVGQISDVVETPRGFHILQRYD